MSFARNVRDLHGRVGTEWLRDLPALVAACEGRWAIRVGSAFPNLSYNFVAPAVASDGTARVPKLGVPSAELSTEIETLRAWAGRGTAHIFASDPDGGAILLEHLRPGTPLAELPDDEATRVALHVMGSLHEAPPPTGLRSLADWTSGLIEAERASFAQDVTPRALALRDRLLTNAPPPVLLHGDLHHDNVLRAEREAWLAIDPKGIVGDPAYDCACFLFNPLERVLHATSDDVDELVARRVSIFAGAFDEARVVGWGFVQAVLSAWWSFEDHGRGHEPALRFAARRARRISP